MSSTRRFACRLAPPLIGLALVVGAPPTAAHGGPPRDCNRVMASLDLRGSAQTIRAGLSQTPRRSRGKRVLRGVSRLLSEGLVVQRLCFDDTMSRSQIVQTLSALKLRDRAARVPDDKRR
jgi:hypothetical protein